MGAEEFLNRAARALRAALRVLAAKKKRKRKQWENVEPLTEEDLKISDEVFDQLREKRIKELEKEKKSKSEKKKTASVLVQFARDNDTFRRQLARELTKVGGWKR